MIWEITFMADPGDNTPMIATKQHLTDKIEDVIAGFRDIDPKYADFFIVGVRCLGDDSE